MPISVDKPKTTEQKHEQSSTSPQQARCRHTDGGSQILPCKENFVTLVRRIKRPRLLQDLVERNAGAAQPEVATVVNAAQGPLAIDARNALFHAVAKLAVDVDVRRFLEQAAERVVLLDDEYGAQAVESVLDDKDESDAAILLAPSDRYSRDLYLLLRQELPLAGAKREQRLDKAERLQAMHRQCKSESENYSSHYLGPMGVVPKIDAATHDMLRERIAALFPQVAADQILIDQFMRRDLLHSDRCGGATAGEAAPVLLYTLTASFNGSAIHFLKVANGELIEYEETVAMSVSFSWEPGTGVLGVFCEDHGARRELASVFGDVMLARAGPINDMPMREFDLNGFSTPERLTRIEQECVAGIEKISVLQIKFSCPFKQQGTDEIYGRDPIEHMPSALLVIKDRRDARKIHKVAHNDYGIRDLTGRSLVQVKLVLRVAGQPHRKAHNVVVQITPPNGLNDKRKTEDDRKRVLKQLAHIGVLRQC